MTTNLTMMTDYYDELELTRADFMGYWHPREIVADPELTIARKKALLAHWASDANAVSGAPQIRRSPAGVTASLDQIRKAMDRLDGMVDAMALVPQNAAAAA